MIEFHEIERTEFTARELEDWIKRVEVSLKVPVREIQYVFCNDEYLYEMNMLYLNHDTYTDIITFDYGDGAVLHGDIFISVDRVAENAKDLGIAVKEELLRVMAHGLLHMIGLKDKTEKEKTRMRAEEEVLMKLFHVEH